MIDQIPLSLREWFLRLACVERTVGLCSSYFDSVFIYESRALATYAALLTAPRIEFNKQVRHLSIQIQSSILTKN